MSGFDPRSFVLVSAMLGLLCAFIFFVLSRSVPKDIQGLQHWAYSYLLMVAAAFLYALQGSIPALYSIFLPNILLVGGIALMYASLLRFGNHPVPYKRLLFIQALLGLLLVWPTLIEDDYRTRLVVICAVNGLLLSACAMVVFKMRSKHFAEQLTQMMFFAAASFSFIQCVAAVLQTGTVYPDRDLSPLQVMYRASFAFLIIAVSLGFMLMVNRRLQLKLEHAADHDSLTGVYRREAFLDLLEKEMNRSHRHKQPLSLLMIDLDNFKAINDEYGHPEGDRVIIDFSRKTQQVLRSHDVIGRYGGEEFMVLLPNTPQDGASVIAERIRLLSAQSRRDDLPSYTVSIGITTLQGSRQPAGAFVSKADQAMYAAKKAGKNRIEVVH